MAAVHPSNLHTLRGRYGVNPLGMPAAPASPGIEGVGVVEALGPAIGAVAGPTEPPRAARLQVGDRVVCTDDEDLPGALAALGTELGGLPRAIDCVAGATGAAVARALAPGGTLLVYGARSSHRRTDPAAFVLPVFAPGLIYQAATVRGWWLFRWLAGRPAGGAAEALAGVLARLGDGTLTLPAARRYRAWDPAEVRAALAAAEAPREGPGPGKPLLDLGPA